MIGAVAHQADPAPPDFPTQADINGPSETPLPGTEIFWPVLGVFLTFLGLVGVTAYVLLRRRRMRRGAEIPRRRWVVAPALVVLFGFAFFLITRPPAYVTPEFPAIPQVLPDEAFYYQDISDLPVHADSPDMISSLGPLPLNPAAGSTVRNGSVLGRPFNLSDATTPLSSVDMYYKDGPYPGPYPITNPAYVQSAPSFKVDNNYIAVDFGTNQMWELGNARKNFGTWNAASGALWDLTSLEYPRGRVTGSGFPILPGLFTYEEVAGGSVDHVVSAGMPGTREGEFVWPARATDGTSTDPKAPPMGSWFRLKVETDLSDLGPQASVVAEALKKHGMVLADTGGALGVDGTPDRRWDDADLATLRTLTIEDFEVVDSSGLMVSPNSMSAAGQGP